MAGHSKNASAEVAASLVLLLATVAALAFANTALADAYRAALATSLRIGLGSFELADPLKVWIKNALMAVFFLFVGLEIKIELREGALADLKRAALPVAGAAGGVLAPALIYLAFTRHDPQAAAGWPIPSATDIAFAVGVLGLLGKRVPVALKAFLLAVAVIDDLIAIGVIALLYTAEINLVALAWAGGALLALTALNRGGTTRLAPYLVVGVALWLCVLQSGINPTLAGVATAAFIPLRGRGPRSRPLHDLVAGLKAPVLFVIMPIFAFANAGVSLAGVGFAQLAEPVTAGIVLGLALGKAAGILGSVWLAIRLGIAHLPAGTRWSQLAGAGFIAGIGFTMSLFIGALAFGDGDMMEQVRLGVLAGSVVSGGIGAAILMHGSRGSLGPGSVDAVLPSQKRR